MTAHVMANISAMLDPYYRASENRRRSTGRRAESSDETRHFARIVHFRSVNIPPLALIFADYQISSTFTNIDVREKAFLHPINIVKQRAGLLAGIQFEERAAGIF